MLHPGPVDTKDNRGKKIKRWYYVDMLKATDETGDREEAIFSVPADRKKTQDFGRATVLDLSNRELEYKNHMIPTERLLDHLDWLYDYEDYWRGGDVPHPDGDIRKFRNSFRKGVLAAFGSYMLPVITLTKHTPKEAVCTVFEKVNTGGVVADRLRIGYGLVRRRRFCPSR